jgi:glycosyltransferase involved in cell wall biosynthesis
MGTPGSSPSGSGTQQRLRVLFLIDTLTEDGGAERMATGLATHLPKERFDVWICSTRTAQPGALDLLREAGVRHINLARGSRLEIHRLWPLIALIRRERFDILHAHKFGSNLWGTLIGVACRVPVVLAHDHTWSYSGDPIRKWLDGRVIGRLATRFIAVSALDAERMVSIEHVAPEKVVLLPNGYVPRPTRNESDVRHELGIGDRVPLVAAVAVLRPQKALSVLLEAHAQVLEEIPEARLVIVGDGPERGLLEAAAQRLGVAHRTHFLGYRPDVDAILRASNVAAMSSDYEGTPVVSFECMANAVPLVATAVGGLPEVVDNGVTGLLVPPRAPHALAGAILELLKDPSLARQMGQAAAQRLPEFTIDASIRQLVTLYETLIAESAAV